ncbi:NAD(P)H-dependent oxidoreductase subunit E [Sneathiella aquimaris]|uniref:NAD(P)H-dependent oxidoreductase subunit E n=1 Tax=Sneathiella aquimaris TaxID=2599305 RepID=UPI00146C21FA|nr:NAD(P)H-dependent oxidoreductase subunit E [Sneathiella aquimaris]
MGKSASFQLSSKAPGLGKRKAKHYAKGRQPKSDAVADVKALLSNQPSGRDQLIEHLHLLQDHFGALTHDHLVALAQEMKLGLAEVYEVATFYHNFNVVGNLTDIPEMTIKVCDSLTCELAGSKALRTELHQIYGDKIKVTHGACMGRCDKAPVVRLKNQYVETATATKTKDALAEEGTPQDPPQPTVSYSDYCTSGGFSVLKDLQASALTAEEIIEQLKTSGHRGLGGAGFPHGAKLESVLSIPGPRYMAVNADESEPGTFKDRHYMNTNPYQFLEGMLIGAEIVKAEAIYIFLRDEYPDTARILSKAIETVQSEGLNKERPIFLRRGAGAYICGEESAMLESLEGKRALPRHKPPFPAHVGLFGRPTLINNVETLYWLPEIIAKGANWYQQGGRHGSNGFRTFSLSGHINKPGVYLTPAGITAQELIDEFGGGMKDGHSFKGYLPGGASGGILPASMADIPLDFGKLEPHGCFVGSAAVIILSDKDDLKSVGRNLMRFFEDESCGQCTPCRAGTEKALALMQHENWDQDLLIELSDCMRDASICGLGQAAPNGLLSLIKFFPEDLA